MTDHTWYLNSHNHMLRIECYFLWYCQSRWKTKKEMVEKWMRTFLYFKWVIVSAALWTMEQLYEWQNSNNVMTYFLFGAIYKWRLLKERVSQKCWNSLMCFSCHIRHLTKCPNWCRTWNICFLLILSWKMLQPNFAF